MDRDSDMTHNVALFGVTGALGRAIQTTLEVEHEGIEALFAVAGLRSAGQTVRWRGRSEAVIGPSELGAAEVDFALFATPREVVSREAPRLLDAGARVIDCSGVLAAPPSPKALAAPAPMVWPQLSSFAKVDFEQEVALALPSAAASTLAPVLDALTHARAGMPRLMALQATLLLPASHAGRAGIDALSRQAVGLLNFQPALDPGPFPAVLAFNAVAPPPDAAVLYEARAVSELRALVPALAAASLELQALWISTFTGLATSLHLTFDEAPDPALVARLLAAHPDLHPAAPPDGDELEADAAEGDEASQAPPGEDPDALSLRDAIDTGHVHLGTPLFGAKTLRLVLMADPLQRTADAAGTLLRRWMAALEA